MTVAEQETLAEALAVGEALLSRRAGSPVILTDPEDLGGAGRSTVVRARMGENPLAADRSVVLKVLGQDAPSASFLREASAYRYATALPQESRPGPQLLASDDDARVLVLTDLGHGRSMRDLLGEDAESVSRGISAWGQALGRMHAATVGGEDDFDVLLRRSVGNDREAGREALAAQAGAAQDRAEELVGRLGLEPAPALFDAIDEGTRMFRGGDLRAFSPSDVGPENILLNEDGVQFMDYEFASFRDASLDVAYALVTFPSYLTEAVLGRRAGLEKQLVDAWRSEVQSLWPILGRDAALARRLLAARTLWVWLSTHWMITGAGEGHDWALQTADARVVLVRWDDLADAARRSGDEALATAAAEVENALRRFWFE